MAPRFGCYELRTTDVSAALEFYTQICGEQFWRPNLTATPLPAAAIAQGAPAHWLGHLGPIDVASTVARVVAAGGQQLGPRRQALDGTVSAVMHDPFGAVLAVTDSDAIEADAVSWHLLTVRDHDRAFSFYADLCYWTAAGEADLGPERGRHRMFSWDEANSIAGSVSDLAQLPHVHAQWLFFFPVADLNSAIEIVRRLGGTAAEPAETMTGDLVAACEDPNRAAFGLLQRRRAGH